MSTSREVREIIREEPLMHGDILRALKDGPHTVPEIAEAIGKPSEETVFWVMGMRRYGKLVELAEPTDEGFFQYAAVRKADGEDATK
ncbi:MAG: MarR family transcriptional regulator [Gemmatimonadota bacterium]